MFNLITTVIKCQDLVLFTIIGSYVELCYIEKFSVNKCHNLKGWDAPSGVLW